MSALVRRWLGGLDDAVPVLDVASVAEVRQRVRDVGASIGLSEVAVASLVSAASELAHNHLRHARSGVIAVRPLAGVESGLEVIAADEGPGLATPAQALAGQSSSKGGLGTGFAAVFELADEVDVDVRLGEGTCIRARKYAARPDTRRRQVGVFGRALSGERISGDDAAFARRPDGGLLLVLADGLGHGPEAREAAHAVVDAALAAHGPIDEAMRAAHRAALGTRGAVMTIVDVGPAGEVSVAAVGNVTAEIIGRQAPRRFGGASWVLGQATRTPEVRLELTTASPADVLVMFSDGLGSRLGFEPCSDLLHERPIVIAERLLERYAKPHDDASILVAR